MRVTELDVAMEGMCGRESLLKCKRGFDKEVRVSRKIGW